MRTGMPKTGIIWRIGECSDNDSPSSLLILPYRTSEWISLAESVYELERKNGKQLLVLDISHLAYPKFINVRLDRLGRWKCVGRTRGKESYQQAFEVLSMLEEADWDSQAYSIRGGGKDSLFMFLKRADKKRVPRILSAFLEVLLGSNEFKNIWVPNGRLAYQKGMARIANAYVPNSKLYFFEHKLPEFRSETLSQGLLTPKFYVSKFPVHSRIEGQRALLSSPTTESNHDLLFENWLAGRMTPGSQTNRFASTWAPINSAHRNKDSDENKNLFLTTSTDELIALGEEWAEDGWTDQYEAFDRIIAVLKEQGETNFQLRIHPNLQNKSTKFVIGELRRIRWIQNLHPDLTIFGPLSSRNTYELISQSTRVFVSGSTAGLEASGLGKPVWCTAANSYDLFADVRRLMSKFDVNPLNLCTWNVDSAKARHYIAAVLSSGEPISQAKTDGPAIIDRFASTLLTQPSFFFVVVVRAIERRLNIILVKSRLGNLSLITHWERVAGYLFPLRR